MIEVRKANLNDVQGIAHVCSEGWRVTYANLESSEYIEKTIEEFYNIERISKEVQKTNQGWNGYFVAVENGKVVGAIGGGFTGETRAEIYVLYVDPNRKGEGIGRALVDFFTNEQLTRGAVEQWVSVQKGNKMGIPFYEAVGFEFQEEHQAYYEPDKSQTLALRYKRNLTGRFQ